MGDCRPTRTLVPQWVTPRRAPWGSWHAAQEDPAAPPAAPGVSPRFGAPGKDVPSRPPPPFLPALCGCLCRMLAQPGAGRWLWERQLQLLPAEPLPLPLPPVDEDIIK